MKNGKDRYRSAFERQEHLDTKYARKPWSERTPAERAAISTARIKRLHQTRLERIALEAKYGIKIVPEGERKRLKTSGKDATRKSGNHTQS